MWDKAKKTQEEVELAKIKLWLASMMEGEGFGFLMEGSKVALAQKEKCGKEIMVTHEELWRLKRRAISLLCGDENTKFFHPYAKCRKAHNTIWEMCDDRGYKDSSFNELSFMEVNHFKSIFVAQQGSSIAEIIKIAGFFPHFVGQEENDSLLKEVTMFELLATLQSFQRDKIQGPNGWPIEFYLGFYDIIGNDLLKVVEESHKEGYIHPPLISTFIALIPKKDSLEKFEDFIPISLCNSIYKIISKIIAKHLKDVLLAHITKKQFGFLEGRQIHEAIGVAQEGMRNIKTKKLKGVVLKIDLSKVYHRFNWPYIHLLLTHMGFHIDFIRCIMSCISSVSFTILINEDSSHFFHLEHGLRQGFPLSPFLFLLVEEGLSIFLNKAHFDGDF